MIPTPGNETTSFDHDTAVERRGAGTYSTVLLENWNIVAGPNGGYVAAIIARAMGCEIADPARTLRSLTVHFLTRPRFESATIEVVIERSGRSVTSVSARMRQGDRLLCTSLAAFSVPIESPHSWAMGLPAEAHLSTTADQPQLPPAARNWKTDLQFDAPFFSGRGTARIAGWIRTLDPRPLDAIALVAMSDALPPAPFPRIEAPMMVPTIDLTVHIRADLTLCTMTPDDSVFAEFITNHIADGFNDEDGFMWAPDGTLLAQSRQLAIAR